jgi:hypothetical protein
MSVKAALRPRSIGGRLFLAFFDSGGYAGGHAGTVLNGEVSDLLQSHHFDSGRFCGANIVQFEAIHIESHQRRTLVFSFKGEFDVIES